MSFKRKLVSAVTTGFAVVAFSTFVSAQDNTKTDQDSNQKREWRGKGDKRGGFGKGMRGGRGGMHGLRGIDLTDAQKEQIRTIMAANRPDEASMQEMRTLMQAKREGTITAEQKERFKSLREQGRLKAEQTHQQVLAILTPEQRQQYEAKKAEMKQKWEERRQERRERRQNRRRR